MTRAVALLSTSSTFQAYKQSCVPASCIPSLLFLPRFQAPQQVLLVLPVAKPVQVSKPRACLIIILHAAFLWLWKRSGWLCNVAETHKCSFHFIISKYTKGCLSADCIFFQEMFISSFALWGFKAQCNLQYLLFYYQEWNALSSTRVFYFLCSFTYDLAIWFRLWSGLKPKHTNDDHDIYC